MVLVVFHDLEFNVVRLMRQQFELLEIRAACSELVFCIVAVFSCNITTHVSHCSKLSSAFNAETVARIHVRANSSLSLSSRVMLSSIFCPYFLSPPLPCHEAAPFNPGSLSERYEMSSLARLGTARSSNVFCCTESKFALKIRRHFVS